MGEASCGRSETVAHIMSRHVTTVPSYVTLAAAWEVMQGNRVRHLPVVDAAGVLCGLLSDRDLLAFMGFSGSGTRPVSAIMQTEIDAVSPDCCIEAAARHILASKHSCLPVLDDSGRLLGIVTQADFLLRLLRDAAPCDCRPSNYLG